MGSACLLPPHLPHAGGGTVCVSGRTIPWRVGLRRCCFLAPSLHCWSTLFSVQAMSSESFRECRFSLLQVVVCDTHGWHVRCQNGRTLHILVAREWTATPGVNVLLATNVSVPATPETIPGGEEPFGADCCNVCAHVHMLSCTVLRVQGWALHCNLFTRGRGGIERG